MTQQSQYISISLYYTRLFTIVLQTIHQFHNRFSQSTRAFSWLKAPTSAFTLKTVLLKNYNKWTLTIDPTVSRCEIGMGPSPRL